MRHLLRTLLIAVLSTFVLYVGWDRLEVYRLHRDIAGIAARGEPTDLADADGPLPTPQHEEAARLYVEAASRAREIGERDFRIGRYDVDAVVGSVNVPELESLYRPDAPALQLLDRANALPFAGFGDVIDGPAWMTPQGLQTLNAVAALRADLLAYRGEGDAAAQALIAAVRLQRTFPDLFQRYFLGTRQFGSLRILLRHSAPSAAALEALQHAFAELPDEDDLAGDLMRRRARLLQQQAEGVYPAGITSLAAVVLHPFLVRMIRTQVEQFPEVIEAARLPWPDKYATLAAMNASAAPPAGTRAGTFGGMLRGSYVNVAAVTAAPGMGGLNLAIRRVACVTLAIERYRRAHAGTLPVSANALVPAFLPAVPTDPFSGDPIVYKPSADAYLVYSIDANRIDNGGVLYGTGSMSTIAAPPTRDFGIKVPLTPRPVGQ